MLQNEAAPAPLRGLFRQIYQQIAGAAPTQERHIRATPVFPSYEPVPYATGKPRATTHTELAPEQRTELSLRIASGVVRACSDDEIRAFASRDTNFQAMLNMYGKCQIVTAASLHPATAALH